MIRSGASAAPGGAAASPRRPLTCLQRGGRQMISLSLGHGAGHATPIQAARPTLSVVTALLIGAVLAASAVAAPHQSSGRAGRSRSTTAAGAWAQTCRDGCVAPESSVLEPRSARRSRSPTPHPVEQPTVRRKSSPTERTPPRPSGTASATGQTSSPTTVIHVTAVLGGPLRARLARPTSPPSRPFACRSP